MKKAHRWTVALALLVSAAALAGCLGGNDGAQAPDAGPEATDGGVDGTEDPSDRTGDDQPEANASEPVEPLREPGPLTLNLSPEQTLTNASVEEGSVPMGGSPTHAVTESSVTVFRSEPVGVPRLISDEPITLQLWLEAQAATVSTQELDIVAWFGSTRGINLIGFGPVGEPVMVPGEPVLVEMELAFDGTRPLVVPSGERLLFYVEALNNEEQAENLHLLTGGETASRLDLTVSRFGVDPVDDLGEVSETTLEGSIPGNVQFLDCEVREGVTYQTHTITVAEDAAYLELNLTGADEPGHDDVDIELLDGGDLVMATRSPGARENILLAGPALQGLQGSELTVEVYACFAQETSYEVTVQQASSTVAVDWTAR